MIGEDFFEQEIDYQEWGGSLYLSWLWGDFVALGGRYQYTKVEQGLSAQGFPDQGIDIFDSQLGSELHEAELFLNMNHSSGWFGVSKHPFLCAKK